MNKPALKRARNMCLQLEATPPPDKRRTLDMSSWGEKNECGTIACVAGYMTLDPKLRKMGLRNTGDFSSGSDFKQLRPAYNAEEGDLALESFLRITRDAVLHLFDSRNPNSFAEAADRFQEVLDGKIG